MIASSLISSINLYTFRDNRSEDVSKSGSHIERGKQVYAEQVYRFKRKWTWHRKYESFYKIKAIAHCVDKIDCSVRFEAWIHFARAQQSGTIDTSWMFSWHAVPFIAFLLIVYIENVWYIKPIKNNSLQLPFFSSTRICCLPFSVVFFCVCILFLLLLLLLINHSVCWIFLSLVFLLRTRKEMWKKALWMRMKKECGSEYDRSDSATTQFLFLLTLSQAILPL